MNFLSPWHPKFVHFPIALLFTGSVLAVIYLLGTRRVGRPAVIWALVSLGWVTLFAAILTGLVDRNAAAQSAAVTALLNPHTAAGFALLVVYGWLLYERLRRPTLLDLPARRWLLIGLFAAGVLLILYEGWLGGKLVFELGVGVQS